MANGKRAVGGVIAVVAGAVLILAASTGGRILEAQSQSQGAVLTGVWFDRFPGGLSSFSTYHPDGTFVTVRGHEFGGSPRPAFRSNLRGIWRQAGNHFEALSFFYAFDLLTGEATGIVGVRSVFRLGPGFDTLSGEFYIAMWNCADSVSCPDPLVTPPDVPEFFGATFTSRRVRMR